MQERARAPYWDSFASTGKKTDVEPNAKKTTLSLKLFASNADECTTRKIARNENLFSENL